MAKRNDVNGKGYLSCAICLFLVVFLVTYEFGYLLNYFLGNDLNFCSLLIKLFGHFNLSVLRISSHFK